MLDDNHLVRAGYSKNEKRPLGFAVNTVKAFESVSIFSYAGWLPSFPQALSYEFPNDQVPPCVDLWSRSNS